MSYAVETNGGIKCVDTSSVCLRIMAVENDELMRKGIEAALAEMGAAIKSFIAKSAEEALQYFNHFNPNVVLTDYAMQCIKGDEFTCKIKKLNPEVKVIALSHHTERAIINAMVSSGADGYLYKNTTVNELKAATEKVMKGEFYFSGDSAKIAADYSLKKLKRIKEARTQLSVREKEVALLIYQEQTTDEIAEILHMTPSGVETVRSRLFKKTNSKNVVGVIKYIFKNGLDEGWEK